MTALPSSTDQLLNRLRMRQVALMLAIDEFRTLHAAAQHLGMTQPAASKMLHELEEALGEALFERVGRGLALNPAGQAVLNTFRGMRNSMASLGRELHELSLGSSGKLLVGSITAAGCCGPATASAASSTPQAAPIHTPWRISRADPRRRECRADSVVPIMKPVTLSPKASPICCGDMPKCSMNTKGEPEMNANSAANAPQPISSAPR